MNYLIGMMLFISIIFTSIDKVIAGSEYDKLMNEWNLKIELASDSLKEAEAALKEGDALEGCVKQREAGKQGVEATQSLIKAFKLSESTQDISNLEAGLNKWKELRDFC